MNSKVLIIITIAIFFSIIACNQNPKSKLTSTANDREELFIRGKEIAENTFKALSQELKKSMEEGGIEMAIDYCNINALPITDRVSKEYNALIKRTSLKYRNPKNAPSITESEILQAYQELKNKEEDMRPQLVENEN